jgi:hypothetical protein
MFRFIGLIVVIAGAVAMVPPLRERAMPYAQPALDPVYTWSARSQVSHIVELVKQEESLGRNIPDPKDFADFVVRHDFQKDAATDPWGSPYYIRKTRKTYYVGSPGKDRVAGTADDIVSATQMARNPAGR